MPSLNHIHTLKRISKGIRGKPFKTHRNPFGGMWQCLDPHCTFRAPASQIKGKASRCCFCGSEIVMGKEEMDRAMPNCLECRNSKAAKQLRTVSSALKDLGIE